MALPGQIENEDLVVGDVPSPGAPWDVIWRFALTFDAYTKVGPAAAAEIASARRAESLDDLRTCLFMEQRSWRHIGSNPDRPGELYIRDLVNRIRSAVQSRGEAAG